MNKPKNDERQVGEKIKLTLSFDNVAKDLGDGVLEAIITTSSIDRHNENIETSGISYKDYMANPVVLWGHDYEGLPIGKAIKLTKQMGTQIKARFQLAIEEYPFANTVYNMIKSGYLNAVSIGGIVREWSEDYRTIVKMDMVEFSIVPVPANPEALITSRSFKEAVGKSEDEFKKEYHDFSRKILVDKMSGLGEDEVKDAIRVMKNLTARLEETAETHLHNDAKHTTKTNYRLVMKDAKAVNTQSQEVIKTLKLTIKGKSNGRQE